MLYIVGLGLNEKGISLEGLGAVKKCKKVYLENYTVEFPYEASELEKVIGNKVVLLDREDVESLRLVGEAKEEDVCLLVYGSPLFATTHISLVEDCRKDKVEVKMIYSASIFDALGETGLQLYKFGKISSMPKWTDENKPTSFLDFVKENEKIEAHSLILVDIGLSFNKAVEQLIIACKNDGVKLDKILVCSRLGNEDGKVFYGKIEDMKGEEIKAPFCFIIPNRMHFLEKEVVERFGLKL